MFLNVSHEIPLNKMARRNILKGKMMVVKTTPDPCNAIACAGDEPRSLGALTSPGLSSGALTSYLRHCEAGAKTTTNALRKCPLSRPNNPGRKSR